MSNAMTVTRGQGFAPQTLGEAVQFSEMLAGSSMVPKAYQGKPQDILVCVQWGYEIGLAPMQALQNIAVINGKPSVYGDAALALVQASSVCESIEETIEGEGTANPVAICIARRVGRPAVIAKFSVEDAKRAGLWGKQGPWQAYPKRMLQMRARGFALRDAFPDVLRGLITAEEAADYPAERDITPKTAPANPLDRVALPKIEAPQPVVQTSDPLVIEQQLADTVDELRQELEQSGVTIVDIPEISEAEAERQAIQSEGYDLRVPGKAEALSTHPTVDEWLIAYNRLADKTAAAGKADPRTRMTKLRELKEVNERVIDNLQPVIQTVMQASHNRRLKMLGAMQTAPEQPAA